ncbi:MAG: hypothetical protein KDH09_17625 [Chrysiogenetes bacterium]|nr:hypothetical protein [Chrysiogenetes bacterium]
MKSARQLIGLALCVAGICACGSGPAYPTARYDGPWCMSFSGECAGGPSDVTLSGGGLTGMLIILDSGDVPSSLCSAGTLKLVGTVYPASSASQAPVDFGALSVWGAGTPGSFAMNGAISEGGGGGEWWNSDRESGTFAMTPGACPVP